MPATVLGPLKLAAKYQADSIREHIVSHLEEDWPTTLDDWDKLMYASEETSSSNSMPPTDNKGCCNKDLLPDPIPFISLAREYDCRDLLGTIFYSLCPDSGLCREKLVRMTQADLTTLILGKKKVMRYVSLAAMDELKTALEEEDFGDSCQARMCHVFVFKTWSAILEDVMFHGDPLTTFRTKVINLRHNLENQEVGNGWMEPTDMCYRCQGLLADQLTELRYLLFDELPSFFAPGGGG
jgi:hypothetical protein